MGAWILASRPATLPVAVAPVAVGTAVAHVIGEVRWMPAAAALAGAVLIQIGTNFANDVFDAEKGADDEKRIGPPRAVQKGLLTPRAVRVGMAVAFGLATLLGIYLAIVGGPVIVAIGIASILSGIAYTGGPYPLGYNGLGDAFVFVFFGPVAVAGTTWVAAGQAPAAAYLASVPVGALATAVLVINNVRDRVGDARTGKRTLVVRHGRRFGVVEHAALHLAAGFAPVLGAIGGWLPATSLMALPVLALGWRITRELASNDDGARLNPLLARQAKVLLAFAAVFAFGIALGG
jgi:1,4-dihydroxy-2-naphthoate octaprenyltransferase